MRVIYRGPARSLRPEPDAPAIARGEVVDLPAATIARLLGLRHRFTPADDGAALPAPQDAPDITQPPSPNPPSGLIIAKR